MRHKTSGPKEIAKRIMDKAIVPGLSMPQCTSLVEEAFKTVPELAVYNPVRTPIGYFRLKTQKERNSRNPKTNEPIIIPAKVKLTFKPKREEK